MPVSGTSNPKLLPYSKTLNIDDVPEIRGKFCYILDDYPDNGFSLLIYRKDETVYFTFGSYSGEEFDMLTHTEFRVQISKVLKNIQNYINLLKLTRVKMIQLYFAVDNDNVLLVDARTHYNKFLGPGMLKDVIAKCGIGTPNVVYIKELTDELINELKTSNKKFIVKTSLPKLMVRNDDVEHVKARI